MSAGNSYHRAARLLCGCVALASASTAFGHGTVVFPESRVYAVRQSNPERPNFALARTAVRTDGKTAYYTWNELSRNIPQAVQTGLPRGFDYSPWVPDGHLASGGRYDSQSSEYPWTYAGLDQVSEDWPTTNVQAGDTIEVDFLATAPHDPSVWDVWMTTPDWDPGTELNWGQMEFLGRPFVTLVSGHYLFDLQIPRDRSGHHVLWIAWQRDDPVGEVFFSTSDLMITAAPPPEFVRGDVNGDGERDISDPIATLAVMFSGDTASCRQALDANDDEAVDLSDAVYQFAALFKGGRLPPPPSVCGVDPTEGPLACLEPPCP